MTGVQTCALRSEFASISAYLSSQNSIDLSTLLRFPDVPSDAFAQRAVVTWDRRDNAFNPHKGTFLVSGFEHTDWFGECSEAQGTGGCAASGKPSVGVPFGHTVRFTETFAFYVPVTNKITLAAELRSGVNIQLYPTSASATYPDRLFFLGGFQSVRGYQQDSMITQEDANHIATDASGIRSAFRPRPFTIQQVAIRGGNFMFNPKIELRIPVVSPLATVLFVDAGNIWANTNDVFGPGFNLRTTVGTGIRLETPIGPLALDGGINMSRFFAASGDPRRSYEDFGAVHFAIGLF